MDRDVLQCTVCLHAFDTTSRRPFDLGCGHSYCEACLRTAPRSFRSCPECRARASNPHANIALLRLLDAMDGGSGGDGGGATNNNNQQQQPQQQQPQPQQRRQQQQPMSAFSPLGAFRSPGGTGNEPVGSLGSMLNQVAAVLPASASASVAPPGSGSSGGSNQSPVVALPGSLATHKANIAQMRTSMWLYLTPLLGALYILSPLDLIPDFIPLIGWLDDALVLYYVVCSLFALLKGQGAASQAASAPGSGS